MAQAWILATKPPPGRPCPLQLVLAHPDKIIIQSPPGLVVKPFPELLHLTDAIQAEAAKVLPQFAPRRERPAVAPKEQPQRPNHPLRLVTGAAAIGEAGLPALFDRPPALAQRPGDLGGT